MKDRHSKKHTKPATAISRLFCFLSVSLLWMELVFRMATVDGFFGSGLFFILLFLLPWAGILLLLGTFSKKPKVNYTVTVIVLAFIALVFSSQIIYFGVFDTFYILYSVKNTGQILQFWWDALLSVWRNLVALLFIWVPVAVYALFGKRYLPICRIPWRGKAVLAVCLVIAQLLASGITKAFNKGENSPAYLYTKEFSADASVKQFGLLTTVRLDAKFLLFGNDLADEPIDDSDVPPVEDTPSEPLPPTEYPKNVIASLDFDKLIAEEKDETIKKMHQYFSSVKPTVQNEYTGKFKGKNLIFIVAEGFSPYAVNETLTPTLYKLSHEGIQCRNYYTPGWGVSTSDGEYTSLLGLMPATGVHSMEYSSNRNMYFSLGNMFKRLNYKTYAFHNHTYTYYGRDKSHPNLGYTYQGIGNGLKLDYSGYYPGKKVETRWPNSDYLMAKATTDKYMNEEPFHTYYLTVSGHMLYTFMGNSMSAYHKNEVENLPYSSDSVKAYLACQIELDLMLQQLVSDLEARGIAEDTVICLTADHYPYGLQQANETDYYSELAGYDTSSVFEKYRNTLILWHKGLESIVIDEPTYSLDLLPTLSNLFGLEYDSRLMMGRDFLSDAPALVCFSNRSWITEDGKYDAAKKTFIPNNGVTVSEDYAKNISASVSRKFTYSNLILKEDYYDKLFG
ncbi:MAG: LTA synthase family protein [Clostridia bacterium]|nr:LTA synthase family protein [Clostridia bacterium]